MKLSKNCKHQRTKTEQKGNVTLEICKKCGAHRVKSVALVNIKGEPVISQNMI